MSITVGILMGSKSDLETMKVAHETLDELGVSSELRILSAHRTPEEAGSYARDAEGKGIKVLIAGAGLAAHLAGALVAQTTLPVIGVPLSAGTLGGLDSLLSTVQMPPGLPVATVAIGGARNAGILAAQIIALTDEALASRLREKRASMAEEVVRKSSKVEKSTRPVKKA